MSTIAAISTPHGVGGIAVVRVSGPRSIAIVETVFRPNTPTHTLATRQSHTLTFGQIIASDGGVLDEVVVSLYRAPHSFTGEDIVEISCHGSLYIQHSLLTLLLNAGCRMAGPGEFTRRAYMNGRIDLSQAEAVADLIASTNKATHDVAMKQMRGDFSTELSRLRDRLLHLNSLLELEIDFSDHEDLEFANRDELLSLATETDSCIQRLARSFKTGQAIKSGIPVAIVGKTNVGKSTLLNRILHEDRAIVSDIHGTTRDTIEDTIDIQGITFRFIDTAGLRQTDDDIEQIGIERTYKAIEKASIVLWLFDDIAPTLDDYTNLRKHTSGEFILVRNKCDEHSDVADGDIHSIPLVNISAKTGERIENLERLLVDKAGIPELQANDVVVTSARHYDALVRAHSSLERVISALGNATSADIISEDLRLSIDALADITGGTITPQETLNNIFANFCIGK